MSGESCRKREVRVVMINTQYIETDSLSFKSVVQRLTGKDAVVEGEEPPVVKGGGGGCEAAQSNSVLLEAELRRDLNSILKFDRRNVLLGLAGASYIATNNTKLTNAAPSNPKVFPNADQIFPSVLDKFVKFTVPRPKKSRSKQEKEDEEEILVIEGIEYNANEYVKFDVFVNDEDEAESGPSNAEFAGAFSNVPSATRSKKVRTRLSLGISELLEDLGAEDDDNLVVALVSRTGQGRVNIGSVSIVISS
ncbi:hypothetical protein ACET3Z_020535 [Daucus carota]